MSEVLVSVPMASIVGMLFTLVICCLAVPAAAWVRLAKGHRGVSSAVLIGCVGFLPQLVVRLPLLTLLGQDQAVADFAAKNTLLYAFLLAFTAALFETAGRVLVFAVLLKKRLYYRNVLGAGLGHGAVEALAIIAIAYVSNLALALTINAGALPSGGVYDQIAQILAGTSPLVFYLAGLERLFAIALHIALSGLVAAYLVRGKPWTGVLLCLMLHTCVDFAAVFLTQSGVPVWFVELLLAAVAVGSMVLMRTLRPRFPEPPPSSRPHPHGPEGDDFHPEPGA